MLSILIKKLIGEWEEQLHNNGIYLIRPISAMQVSSGRNKDRKILFLVFNHNDKKPILVIKIARTSGYQNQIKREYKTLSSLWGIEALRPSIPQPLGLFEFEGQLVSVEESLPGKSMSTLIKRRGYSRFSQIKLELQKARKWLELLQAVTQSEEGKLPGRSEIEGNLYQINSLKENILPGCFTEKILSLAEECKQIHVPLVGCHGDFHPGNIIQCPDKIGIIDWEDFALKAYPYNDVFNFIILYAQQFSWHKWKKTKKKNTFKFAFLENNGFSRLIHTYVRDALNDAGLSMHFGHFYFSSFLLERATPTNDQSPKQQQQASQWQARLSWYANNEKDSIFFLKD